MDEHAIYQNMSQLVFNAVMRGESREKALQDAEETLRALVKKSKEIAESLPAATTQPGPSGSKEDLAKFMKEQKGQTTDMPNSPEHA